MATAGLFSLGGACEADASSPSHKDGGLRIEGQEVDCPVVDLALRRGVAYLEGVHRGGRMMDCARMMRRCFRLSAAISCISSQSEGLTSRTAIRKARRRFMSPSCRRQSRNQWWDVLLESRSARNASCGSGNSRGSRGGPLDHGLHHRSNAVVQGSHTWHRHAIERTDPRTWQRTRRDTLRHLPRRHPSRGVLADSRGPLRQHECPSPMPQVVAHVAVSGELRQ